MNVYTIALFLHVVGACAYFATVALLVVGTVRLQRVATIAVFREWAGLLAATERWIPVSGGVLLLSGVYMVATASAWRAAWVVVALIVLAVLVPFFPLVIGRRLDALHRAAAQVPGESIPASLAAQTHDATLRAILHAIAGASLGIVFLMTVKPGLWEAITALAVSLGGGIATSIRPIAHE